MTDPDLQTIDVALSCAHPLSAAQHDAVDAAPDALARVASRLERAEEALRTIAERRVPTTFGGGWGAVVNFARAELARSASPGEEAAE